MLRWVFCVIGSLSSSDCNSNIQPKNKLFGIKGDYFVIVSSSLHPLLLTEHTGNGLLEVPLK